MAFSELHDGGSNGIMSIRCVEWGWVAVARLQKRLDSGVQAISPRASGQSTVEYALVGALVVIAAAGAMTLLGDQVTNVFSKITNTLSGAASATH